MVIIIEGIVVASAFASVPPIEIGGPEILFIIITAIAPASWANFILSEKGQLPLLIKAIFPVSDPTAEAPQPSEVGAETPSLTKTIFAVIGVVTRTPKAVLGIHG